MKKYFISSIVVVIIFMASFFVAFAQEKTDILPNTVDCFDYYDFGSVHVNLMPNAIEYEAGSEVNVKAIIENKNNYPIVDGSLYIKVYKKQTDTRSFYSNGNFLVDQFFAIDDVQLPANGSREVSFKWIVPREAVSGKYQLAAFFQSAKKFNLAGLSFTDDVLGSFYDFSVKNNAAKGDVSFDKNKILIDGKVHSFVGFLRSRENKAITIEAPLVNTTSNNQEVEVSYDLYYWDSLLEENKISQSKEKVSVEAGKALVLKHVVDPNMYPVNYLVITAKYKDSKSILDIRYLTQNDRQVRLNFPAITNFPLSKDKKNTVFSCLHAVEGFPLAFIDAYPKEIGSNTSPDAQKGSNNGNQYTVSLILKDKDNNIIQNYNYQGNISGKMMGIKSDFVPSVNLDVFTLEAIIKDKNGKIQDKTVMHYDCAKIDKSLCFSSSLISSNSEKSSSIFKNKAFLVGIIPLIILLLVIFIRWRRKTSGWENTAILILVITAGLLFTSLDAQAKNVIPNVSDVPNMAYQGASQYYDYYWELLGEASADIVYSAASGWPEGTIDPGRQFTLSTTFSGSWSMEGYMCDTPYVYWNENASDSDHYYKKLEADNDLLQTLTVCNDGDGSGRKELRTYYLYAPMVFNPPSVSLNITGPATCGATPQKTEELGLWTYTWTCQVNGDAANGSPIGITISYSDTYGKVYTNSQVEWYKNHSGKACEIDPDDEILVDAYFFTAQQKMDCTYSPSCGSGASPCSSCPFNSSILLDGKKTCSSLGYDTCHHAETGGWPEVDYSRYNFKGACDPCEDARITVDQTSTLFNYTVSQPSNNEIVTINLKDDAGNLISAYDGFQSRFTVNGVVKNGTAFSGGVSTSTADYVSSGLPAQKVQVSAPNISGYTVNYGLLDYSQCGGSVGGSEGWLADKGTCIITVKYDSSPATVTISGTVKDSLGNPMAGQPIETCQGLVNTDASGYWQHTVDDGSSYCARVNGLPGGSTVVATSIQFCHVGAPSYEHQVAGRNMFFNCDNPNAPSSWDRSNPDTNIDFTVTLGGVINGSCGLAASPPNYAYNETLFRGTFCGTGTANPANPAFPAEGATTNWQCVGSGAGHTDASCSAIRNSCSPTYSCQVPTCAPEECGITKGQTCINSCTGGGVAESNCPGGSCGTTTCPACAKSGDWKEVKP